MKVKFNKLTKHLILDIQCPGLETYTFSATMYTTLREQNTFITDIRIICSLCIEVIFLFA